MSRDDIDWIVQGSELRTLTLSWPEGFWPVKVDKLWERDWSSSLPFDLKPAGAWTFIGLDQGDHAEVDLEVYAQSDELEDEWPMVLRSLHRHDDASFESWELFGYEDVPSVRTIRVFCRLRKMPDVESIRGHFGLNLVGLED